MLPLFALLVTAATAFSPIAAQQPYRIGPAPAWVTPIRPDLNRPLPKEQVSQGYELLLVDNQELVTRKGLERFSHIVYRVLTEGAVQDQSLITIQFRPAYQGLVLNGAAVIRDGRPINQLRPAQIRVAQQEPGLESYLFEESTSITIVLEDVKPGDVVEYSFSRLGANPVFNGHYIGYFTTQRSVPVGQLSHRIVAPRDRDLKFHTSEPIAKPTITEVGDRREYRWTATDVAPRLIDANVPDWHDPLPTVRTTDYSSWNAVAAWADSLFVVPARLPAQLAGRLARIRADHSKAADRVIAAIRFVQDSIRYVGIEIGANSHQPFPPATVLARGYGDCKDKVLLLMTMLRALDIEAQAALVSTFEREHVRRFPATTASFDHAIVRLEADGATYWVDPTALYQRGALNTLAPRFGAALVVSPTTDSLTAIPTALAGSPRTEIAVRYELAGVGEPASMRVETRYLGTDADGARTRFRAQSPAGLEKEYLDYYAKQYPDISSKHPPTIEDDEPRNLVRMVEEYTIPAFWEPTKDGKGHIGTLQASELYDVVPSLRSAKRSMPLAVGFPVHYRYTITAHLAAGWNIGTKGDSVTTPAARFVWSEQVEGKDLVLRYEYQALADHVSVGATSGHLAKVATMRDRLSFGITPPSKDNSTPWWERVKDFKPSVVLLGVATLVATLGLVLWLRRHEVPAWFRNEAEPDQGMVGLGGWLILVGVGIAVRAIAALSALFDTTSTLTESWWATHTLADGANYHQLWAPIAVFETVANSALLVVGVWLIVEFFGRRRWFPPLFIVTTIAAVGVELVDAGLVYQVPEGQAKGFDWTSHLRDLSSATIWSFYMVRSVRVKGTFVR